MGLLRSLLTFLLYASLIRDQKSAADTACPVRPHDLLRSADPCPERSRRIQVRSMSMSGRDARGPRMTIEIGASAARTAGLWPAQEAQLIGGCDLEELPGSLSETPQTPETSRPADGSACSFA